MTVNKRVTLVVRLLGVCSYVFAFCLLVDREQMISCKLSQDLGTKYIMSLSSKN
jgi:hypothetical protein